MSSATPEYVYVLTRRRVVTGERITQMQCADYPHVSLPVLTEQLELYQSTAQLPGTSTPSLFPLGLSPDQTVHCYIRTIRQAGRRRFTHSQ